MTKGNTVVALAGRLARDVGAACRVVSPDQAAAVVQREYDAFLLDSLVGSAPDWNALIDRCIAQVNALDAEACR